MNRKGRQLLLEQLEARLALRAGNLDLTFSADGFSNLNLGSAGQLSSVLVQEDGKILAAGTSSDGFTLNQLNADGTPDSDFGTAGRVTTRFAGNSVDAIQGLALQQDYILAVGSSLVGGVGRIALARYLSDGTLDTTFGSNGLVLTEIQPGVSSDGGDAILVLSDNSMVVSGVTGGRGGDFHFSFVVVRYSPNGAIDTDFGSNGFAIADFGRGVTEPHAVALQEDGKIIVVGESDLFTTPNNTYGVSLAQFTPEGTLDASFGTNGLVLTDIPGKFLFERGEDVAVQSDGKIVVSGNIGNTVNDTGDLLLLRYNEDGSLDRSFSRDGVVIRDLGGSYEIAEAVVVTASGELVVAGAYARRGADDRAMVARFKSNGKLDKRFGVPGDTIVPGVVVTGIPVASFVDAALVGSDKLIAGGTQGLARYDLLALPPTAAVELIGGVLQIIGTRRDDMVHVEVVGNLIRVSATLGGVEFERTFEQFRIEQFRIKLGDGDDVAVVGDGVGVRGLILGGQGDDVLTTGNSQDVLIGGPGSDALNGGEGGDLLIGESTLYDGSLYALDLILAEWSSDRLGRVENLRGSGRGLQFFARQNKHFFLIAEGAEATVFDDGQLDQYLAVESADWVFVIPEPGPR